MYYNPKCSYPDSKGCLGRAVGVRLSSSKHTMGYCRRHLLRVYELERDYGSVPLHIVVTKPSLITTVWQRGAWVSLKS